MKKNYLKKKNGLPLKTGGGGIVMLSREEIIKYITKC